MRLTALFWAALLAGIAACGGPDARAELPAAGRVVDSILPREEALRRFREGLPPVDSLSGGAESRDALVAEFVRALGGGRHRRRSRGWRSPAPSSRICTIPRPRRDCRLTTWNRA